VLLICVPDTLFIISVSMNSELVVVVSDVLFNGSPLSLFVFTSDFLFERETLSQVYLHFFSPFLGLVEGIYFYW
jgi:hypothetical protein